MTSCIQTRECILPANSWPSLIIRSSYELYTIEYWHYFPVPAHKICNKNSSQVNLYLTDGTEGFPFQWCHGSHAVWSWGSYVVLRCIGLQVTANLTQGLTDIGWAVGMVDSAAKCWHQRLRFFPSFQPSILRVTFTLKLVARWLL